VCPHGPPHEDPVVADTGFGPMWVHAGDPYIGTSLRRWGLWEPSETAYMRWRLRAGMTVVDVGAHVGWYSVVARQAVGPSGRVVAVEPDPANVALLRRNVAGDGGAIVEVHACALGATTGTATLHLADENTGDHRVYPTVERRPALTVPQRRLDDLLAPGTVAHLVKMDVQGAEEGVLDGMPRLIARSPALVMLVEYWPHGLTAFGSDPDALLARYRALFTVEVLYPEAAFPLPLDVERLRAYCGGDSVTGQVTLVLTRRPG
jgi:FkbM family methyltransferase